MQKDVYFNLRVRILLSPSRERRPGENERDETMKTDSQILAANKYTAWTMVVLATEGSGRILASASSEEPARAIIFCRAQAEFSGPDAAIYQRTKKNTWIKRAVRS